MDQVVRLHGASMWSHQSLLKSLSFETRHLAAAPAILPRKKGFEKSERSRVSSLQVICQLIATK